MNPEYIKPEDIERRSFEIISGELKALGVAVDPETAPVLLRVIHTTADFDYAENLIFSPRSINAAVAALKRGAVIVSDTNMVKAGVDKNRLKSLGGEVICYMGDGDIFESAKINGVTRAYASMDKAAGSITDRPLIFAIGNAPTALMRICELYKAGVLRPGLVIGAPVGFVNVVESKEALMASGMEYIAAKGRKGGSNVAAAITNALLRIVETSC